MYISYCLTTPGFQSLFTVLFTPVFDRQLSKLGLEVSDILGKRQLLSKCCNIFAHHQWQLEWLVIHDTQKTDVKMKQYFQQLNIDKGSGDESKHPKKLDYHECRIETDRKFLALCLAIASCDITAMLTELTEYHINLDDVNFCFGNTILAYAVQCGNLEVIALLLSRVPKIRPKHLAIYIQTALTSRHPSTKTIDILLSRFSGRGTQSRTTFVYKILQMYPQIVRGTWPPLPTITICMLFEKISSQGTTRTNFATAMLEKSYLARDGTTFNAVLAWMATTSCRDFPDRLHIIEHVWHITTSQMHYPFKIIPVPDKAPVQDCACGAALPPVNRESDDDDNDDDVIFESWLYRRRHQKKRRYKPVPKGIVFQVIQKIRSIEWLDWFLWAGADPRHFEGQASVLEVADKVGNKSHVVQLLHKHGWECGKLEMRNYEDTDGFDRMFHAD